MGIVLDPIKCFPSHPSEEILEEYVFDRLPEVLVAQVEEHLLICERCQDTVAATDRFAFELKEAAKETAPAIDPVRSGWLGARTSLAAVALVILAFVVVWKHPQETFAPVAVSLSSLRGAGLLSSAPAGRPLQLSIESPDLAPDLTADKEYRVELVDAAGRPVWKGSVSTGEGKLVATMTKPLPRGMYWVRLYGADSELLREFGLSAK